jgi:hypothetical protein
MVEFRRTLPALQRGAQNILGIACIALDVKEDREPDTALQVAGSLLEALAELRDQLSIVDCRLSIDD